MLIFHRFQHFEIRGPPIIMTVLYSPHENVQVLPAWLQLSFVEVRQRPTTAQLDYSTALALRQ